uniref:Uncharacterized protein n=1 Tax=Arundo donax TaxID=35708 RepID=A0A0A9G1J7_ARUDO
MLLPSEFDLQVAYQSASS